MRKYIEAGKIINTHGVRGGLKIESWCDSPSVFASLSDLFLRKDDGSFELLKVMKSSVLGDKVVAAIEGIDSFEKADKLKNSVVYARHDDIPLSGGVLIDDMKGLPVIDDDNGTVYGILSDVIKYGDRDIYEIICEEKSVLLPAVKEFVKRVDTEKGIFITPIPGFFDEN